MRLLRCEVHCLKVTFAKGPLVYAHKISILWIVQHRVFSTLKGANVATDVIMYAFCAQVYSSINY